MVFAESVTMTNGIVPKLTMVLEKSVGRVRRFKSQICENPNDLSPQTILNSLYLLKGQIENKLLKKQFRF